MKLLSFLIVAIATASFASEPVWLPVSIEAFEPGLAIAVYETPDGQYKEELVKIPDGACLLEYSVTTYTNPEIKERGVSEYARKSFMYRAQPGGTGFVGIRIEFSDFRQLVNSPPRFYYDQQHDVAQVGRAPLTSPPPQPSMWDNTIEFSRNNPWLVGAGVFVVLDIVEGGGLDLFGVLDSGGSSSGDSSRDSGTAEGSVVVQGSSNTTINVTSPNNNDSTSPPAFPPQ